RLRLDSTQHSRPATFVPIGVRSLPDKVFVAAVAVGHKRSQIALRAARKEKRRLLTRPLGYHRLQAQHGRISTPNIVTNVGAGHRSSHRPARPTRAAPSPCLSWRPKLPSRA